MVEYIKRDDALRQVLLVETRENMFQRIKDLPAADVVERKTGRWIPMEVSSGRDSWKCSVCGRRARGKLENLPYCHCGAKMEGDPFDDNPPMEYFESGGK